MKKIATFFLLIFLSIFKTFGQEPPKDWHLLDKENDGYPGISLQKAYNFLEEKKLKPTKVIVAVLDSGVDIFHEDLIPVLWTNEKEIENNTIDDDGNGYVDDFNGWNFIGGKDSISVESELLELTKFYKKYKQQFEGKNKYTITVEEVEDFDKFIFFKEKYEEGKKELEERIKSNEEEFAFFDELIPPLQEKIGKTYFTEKELKKERIKTEVLNKKRATFFRILERNKEKELTSLKLIKHYEELSSRMETLKTRLQYNYSLTFNSAEIVNDNPENLDEKFYGNNDVTKRAEHGTHVSGIIGAARNNKIGINGIANNVRIMPIRNTPMGDERDKDVANGIIYAVDNGAKIVNMSFGKSFSPNKEIVDKAILYAKENGVLLVHAAGNDAKNTSYFYNFPTALLEDKTVASNWIEIGASSFKKDENLVAEFSNYGNYSVDIFAPGVEIYATILENKYDTRSGTSMAAPVATGVATLLKSYFPHLTPEQIIEIIMASGTKYDIEVNLPGYKDKKVNFSSLSKSGKIINAYEAVKLAFEKYNNKN